MRITTFIIGSVAGLAGLATAVTGYQLVSATPAAETQTQVAAAEIPEQPKVEPKVKVRFAPCAQGTTLEHGKCVTHVVNTVVVPVARPAAAPVRHDSDDSDEGREHVRHESSDDDDEARGDDDEREDHEDDDDDHEDEPEDD